MLCPGYDKDMDFTKIHCVFLLFVDDGVLYYDGLMRGRWHQILYLVNLKYISLYHITY